MIRNGDHLIIDLGVQNRGDEVRPDALNAVGGGIPLAEQGRCCRLCGDNMDAWVLLLEIPPNSGDGSSGAYTGNQKIYPPIGVLPNLRTGVR